MDLSQRMGFCHWPSTSFFWKSTLRIKSFLNSWYNVTISQIYIFILFVSASVLFQGVFFLWIFLSIETVTSVNLYIVSSISEKAYLSFLNLLQFFCDFGSHVSFEHMKDSRVSTLSCFLPFLFFLPKRPLIYLSIYQSISLYIFIYNKIYLYILYIYNIYIYIYIRYEYIEYEYIEY